MDRAKLIERLRKLLAMSRDTSSPVEAAIATRRMKALMGKFDVTLAEIADTDRNTTGEPSVNASGSSTRRKRRRKRPPVQRKRTVRPVILAASGIAIAVGSWLLFTSVNNTGSGAEGGLARQVVQGSRQKAPSLNTKVERSSIMEGESIVLHVSGSAVSSVPSTSSLLQDFRIIETQVKRAANTQDFHMRVELQPRETGMLFIPSFYVDGIRTEGIIIDVVARN